MIKLTQSSAANRVEGGNGKDYSLYLAPESIESIASNPNYGLSSIAARTVIRMKVTGAIHFVDETPEFIRKAIG